MPPAPRSTAPREAEPAPAPPPAPAFGPALVPSRFLVAVREAAEPLRVALFSTATGALTVLDGVAADALADALYAPGLLVAEGDLAPALLSTLRRGGVLVPQGTDELAPIQERYRRARGETPVVLTVTTTMDCNLGCYYCYEARSGARLETRDIGAIVALARERLALGPHRALHVDWYGGEPLLERGFVEAASRALQDACAADGVRYVASIISNGTDWPEDVEAFVARHRIRQVQISFDGMQANHDKRRRWRRGRAPQQGPASTFARAVALVDRLVRVTRVDVRFNVDAGNRDDVLPFVAFARARGWFDAPVPAVFQPARLASYSETSRFMRRRELPLADFDAIRAEVRAALDGVAVVEESEVPDGFPHPKTSVCAALAHGSAVLGADGLVYRCGLQVGEAGRAVSAMPGRSGGSARVGTDAGFWTDFDPTQAPTCSACTFLPICWGGCPKKHLEGDRHALDEQGRYWRTNLPRLVARAAGFASGPAEDEIPLAVQFRARPGLAEARGSDARG